MFRYEQVAQMTEELQHDETPLSFGVQPASKKSKSKPSNERQIKRHTDI